MSSLTQDRIQTTQVIFRSDDHNIKNRRNMKYS